MPLWIVIRLRLVAPQHHRAAFPQTVTRFTRIQFDRNQFLLLEFSSEVSEMRHLRRRAAQGTFSNRIYSDSEWKEIVLTGTRRKSSWGLEGTVRLGFEGDGERHARHDPSLNDTFPDAVQVPLRRELSVLAEVACSERVIRPLLERSQWV